MAVTELLINLIDLQKIDKELFDLKKLLEGVPFRIKELDKKLESASISLKKKEDEHKALLVKKKDKELELESKETNIKKYQGQLYQVKTNNEYAAIEKEIAGQKADKSVLEEDILNLFDQIEAAEKALAGEKALLNDEKKKIEAESKALEAEKKDMEVKIAELKEKRKAVIPLIDKETLARYEKILNGKEGLALVPVKGENCGGCFVNLPPQVVNEIKLKDKIIYCERCARMLYTEE